MLVGAGANATPPTATASSRCRSPAKPAMRRSWTRCSGPAPIRMHPAREGKRALMTAARAGRVESVDLLIARGAAVNAKAWRGQTALMWAAAEGYADVVQTLIEHGADITTRSNGGFTALLFAVPGKNRGRACPARRRRESTRVTGAAGATVPKSEAAAAPETGLTALLVAIGSGHFELASFLLDRGADPAGTTRARNDRCNRNGRGGGSWLPCDV